MSLPQTECAVPPGAQASVIVSPSLPLSEVAFASQVVGFPSPAADGGAGGAVFEFAAEVPPWPPSLEVAVLLSFLILEHAAPPDTIALNSRTAQRRMVSFDRYDDFTWADPFV
jgi:hypothetical protein